MSLDVYIKYKKPKKVNYNDTHSACGSNMAIVPDSYECEEDCWSANITHNMGEMADHVPVDYIHEDGESYENTLYAVVWRPEEYNIHTTDVVGQALAKGIAYMVLHKNELLKYNPENGWGSYDAFLDWLIVYKRMCDENPGCEIEAWR